MKLEKLLASIPHSILAGSPRVEIKDIALDSRQVRQGYLFVAIAGASADGHAFIDDAVQRGATAVLITRDGVPVPDGVCVARADGSPAALAALAHAFYGQPPCTLIGITGTNGKTTTSYLVRHFLERAGIATGIIGTVAYAFGARSLPAVRTTPDAFELHRLLKQMSESGAQAVAMEVSSHALDQDRIGSLEYDVALFTNLTQDHLDYHRTMEQYFAAKAKLFGRLKKAGGSVSHPAVVCTDDPYGVRIVEDMERAGVPALTFGAGPRAAVRAEHISVSPSECRFDLAWPGGGAKDVHLGMIGRHNVSNCLGALAAAYSAGVNIEALLPALANVPAVPGRLEFIPNTLGFVVVVDYAHTDDALHKALTALRELKPAKLVAVFGCGGDRDRAKRPRMGAVAEELADLVVVTSDNPRSEHPDAIISEIRAGMARGREIVEPDRRAAIAAAIDAAGPGDIVLIAGKGHETYQIINRVFYDFDDRVVARELLARKEHDVHQ